MDNQTPDKQAAGMQTPNRQVPTGQAPNRQAAGMQTPNRQVPTGQVPNKQATGMQTPNRQTPTGQVPNRQATGMQAPNRQVPTGQVSTGQVPNRQAAGKQAAGAQDAGRLLKVGSSPHIKSSVSTSTIMRDVLIALAPALIWGVYIFGFRALTLTLLSVASCVLFEYLFCLVTKKRQTVSDLSAVVTGVLLAFNIPSSAPFWLPVIGGAFAIVVVKMLFGGIGKNFMNPALAARVFLFFSFPAFMSGKAFALPEAARKLSPFAWSVKIPPAVDGVTSATVLNRIEEGVDSGTLADMFYGNMGGCIGEVSKLCLLIGLLYLLLRRVVSWHIPVAYIGVFFLLTFIFPRGQDEAVNFALAQLLSGGLVLGAFFMATDYTTSPLTSGGKLIYGALCGALTVFFRYFGSYPEGVSFAILIMNTLVYYFDRLTKPAVYGGGENAKKAKK